MKRGLTLTQQAKVIAQLAESLAAEASIIEADRGLRLAGFKEAAALLGVDHNLFKTMRKRQQVPAPVAELACGPVWRVEDLEAFAATRDEAAA